MSESSREHYPVLYPQRERAAAFLPEGGVPFREAVIGITYPYGEYRIDRDKPTRHAVIEYVERGKGSVLVNGTWQTVEAGALYLLPQGIPHHYAADREDPWQKIWINYEASYFTPLLEGYGVRAGVYRLEGIAPLFHRLLAYAEEGGNARRTVFDVAQTVHELLHRLSLSAYADEFDTDAAAIREALSEFVYEKLDLDVLALRLHLSKSTLIRSFKHAYGQTPYDYLLTQKIESAKLLLRDTGMTVAEIAARLAFSDAHYFSNLFTARTGIRPRAYRQSARR